MGEIWVVPNNDLEAKTIIELLKKNGKEVGKNLLITGQGWGASWDGLEEEIKKKLEKNRNAVKTITEEIEEPITTETQGSWTVRKAHFITARRWRWF